MNLKMAIGIIIKKKIKDEMWHFITSEGICMPNQKESHGLTRIFVFYLTIDLAHKIMTKLFNLLAINAATTNAQGYNKSIHIHIVHNDQSDMIQMYRWYNCRFLFNHS
ncbi:hypothetical protein ACJX0J_034748 [Zea mays]